MKPCFRSFLILKRGAAASRLIAVRYQRLGFRVPPAAEYSVQGFKNAAEVQREIKQMQNISTAIISISTHCGASSSSTTTAVMQSSESSSDTTKRGTLRFL
ncbi:MAG TPA: hypothetical protein DCY17_03850 [Clostridiales bacterium]|nr:hypothetical protein [Clostridiales bacterium]